MRLCLILLAGLLGAVSAEATGNCDAAPPRLDPPAPREAPPEPSAEHPRFQDRLGWYHHGFWGFGFLRPDGEPAEDWVQVTVLPLYDGPGGQHVGWLNRGWLELAGRKTEPVSPFAFIETGYETNSLILAQIQEDGWLALRLQDQEPTEGHLLWTHGCRLDQGDVMFEQISYEEEYLGSKSSYFFRSPVPHALRVEPALESDRIDWIVEGDDLEVLEVRKQWMRVRVFRPGKYFWLCSEGGEWQGKTLTGWVTWRSPEKGTWLQYPTRGC